MDLNPDEVRLKRELAARCQQIVGIFDHTKWVRSGLLSFASTDQVAAIVTDSAAPAELAASWRGRGVEVVLAEPDPSRPPERGVPGRLRPTAARPTLVDLSEEAGATNR